MEDEPPPEWLFFSGVFDFLLRPPVMIRWVYATLGFCVLGLLWAFCYHLYDTGVIYAMAFFVLPSIWITIMTLSYAAACSLPIILETSAGNDKVEGWPEPVLKEQAADLVYLGYLLIIAEVLSALAGEVLSIFFGSVWLPAMICGYLFYPMILLSSLEAGTPFMPLTWPIVRSLKSLTWAWGAFYGLTAALTAVWVLPLYWQFGEHPFLMVILAAPLEAAWCFLCARLLGRLGWRISLDFEPEEDEKESAGDQQHPARKKKKRKKKPDESESSGELQTTKG